MLSPAHNSRQFGPNLQAMWHSARDNASFNGWLPTACISKLYCCLIAAPYLHRK